MVGSCSLGVKIALTPDLVVRRSLQNEALFWHSIKEGEACLPWTQTQQNF